MNCPAGGVRISVGASTEFACNGLPGSSGVAGRGGVWVKTGDGGVLGLYAGLGTPGIGSFHVYVPDAGYALDYQWAPSSPPRFIPRCAGYTTGLRYQSNNCSGTAWLDAPGLIPPLCASRFEVYPDGGSRTIQYRHPGRWVAQAINVQSQRANNGACQALTTTMFAYEVEELPPLLDAADLVFADTP